MSGNIIAGLIIALVGGLITGLVLRRTDLKFRSYHLMLLLLGWIFAWFVAGSPFGDFSSFSEELAFQSGLADMTNPPIAIGLINGAIYGLFGGTIMLGLILWAQQSVE